MNYFGLYRWWTAPVGYNYNIVCLFLSLLTVDCWAHGRQQWVWWQPDLLKYSAQQCPGTSCGNAVVFSCHISEGWFHGIGNMCSLLSLSTYLYLYIYWLFKQNRKFQWVLVQPNFPIHTMVHVCIYIHTHITLLRVIHTHTHTLKYLSLSTYRYKTIPFFICWLYIYIYIAIITH